MGKDHSVILEDDDTISVINENVQSKDFLFYNFNYIESLILETMEELIGFSRP